MRQVALTTEDNPYDPIGDFDNWYAWDAAHGYNSASYLARMTYSSPDLSEGDQLFAIESAIDDIVEANITGNYKKVVRESADTS